jgi:hypothetical protein
VLTNAAGAAQHSPLALAFSKAASRACEGSIPAAGTTVDSAVVQSKNAGVEWPVDVQAHEGVPDSVEDLALAWALEESIAGSSTPARGLATGRASGSIGDVDRNGCPAMDTFIKNVLAGDAGLNNGSKPTWDGLSTAPPGTSISELPAGDAERSAASEDLTHILGAGIGNSKEEVAPGGMAVINLVVERSKTGVVARAVSPVQGARRVCSPDARKGAGTAACIDLTGLDSD